MKKICIALLLPLAGFAQTKQSNGFEVKGNISGLKDSTIVYLINGMNGKTVATATARKGVFTLRGLLTSPELHQVGFAGRQEAFEIFLGNENVTATGDVAAIANTVIKGSPTQDDYQIYKDRFSPLKEKVVGTATLIDPEKDPARKDSLVKVFNVYKNEVIATAANYVKERPASPVSAFILFAISPLMSGIEELEANYNQLQPAALQNTYAKALASTISNSKIGMVGTQALAFTQKDTANKPVSLASFKGKYVLIDFWASWCRPCRMENPNVVKAYTQYKNKNFTVLGVSLDQSKESWLKAIKEDKLTWTHVSDLQYWNNAVAQLYRITSIPANLLLDPNGKIIGKDLRAEELQETLKNLLK